MGILLWQIMTNVGWEKRVSLWVSMSAINCCPPDIFSLWLKRQRLKHSGRAYALQAMGCDVVGSILVKSTELELQGPALLISGGATFSRSG